MLKISVVVPFYNPPLDYFKECVEALKKLNPFEVLLVDDCSTEDELVDYAKSSGFRYLKTEYQSGYDGTPFNLGVQKAQGDYICRVDSDDQLLALPTTMETDVCFGRLDRVKPPVGLTIEELILAPRSICNAIVVKREILLKHPMSLDSNVYGDVLLVLQLLNNGYSRTVFSAVNYVYRRREGSIQATHSEFHHRLRLVQTVARFCQLEKVPPERSVFLLQLAMENVKYGSKALKLVQKQQQQRLFKLNQV
ncbi:MAG: glycosyltransferase family 2 protein [Pseudomonadota bacterium]|nr:glycosyltransferase family 2 protein [Pseudomonadota bacterium]